MVFIPTDVLRILENGVRGGGLDGDVVATLRARYEEIDGARIEEQAAYLARQESLGEIAGWAAAA